MELLKKFIVRGIVFYDIGFLFGYFNTNDVITSLTKNTFMYNPVNNSFIVRIACQILLYGIMLIPYYPSSVEWNRDPVTGHFTLDVEINPLFK